MESSRYKDASTLLSAFFDKERFAEGSRFSELYGSWRAIVGERYAAHSRPDDVSKGILYVEVEHPGWIQLLQFRQAGILESVRRSYPEFKLRSIVFRLEKDGLKPGAEAIRPESGSVAGEGVKNEPCPEVALSFDDANVDPEVRSMFQGLKKLVDQGN